MTLHFCGLHPRHIKSLAVGIARIYQTDRARHVSGGNNRGTTPADHIQEIIHQGIGEIRVAVHLGFYPQGFLAAGGTYP